MTISTNADNGRLTFSLEGRLDTTTSPQLEKAVHDSIAGVKELCFDFKELAYISSAGLRVLLSAQKIMNKQGKMIIRNANEDILEVFEVTGFIDILNVEE